MVHFLRRRARLNRLGGRIVHEELDWWMLYLENGLYFEADPPADPVRYLSQTDALDAWVLHDRGLRDHPAPKPHQRLGPFAQRMLDSSVPNARAAGSRPDAPSCTRVRRLGNESAATWTRPGIGRASATWSSEAPTRSVTHPNPCSSAGSLPPIVRLLIFWSSSEDLVEDARDDPGSPRVLGLALTESSPRPYDALLVVESRIWEGHRRAR